MNHNYSRKLEPITDEELNRIVREFRVAERRKKIMKLRKKQRS